MKPLKSWRLVPTRQELRDQLSRSLDISPVIAQLLINRGIVNEQDASTFLHAGIDMLGDPFGMKDMDQAVRCILNAIEKKDKITVYGDYDVDGITSCAILIKLLTKLGAQVEYYIPERQSEGYGLNKQALDTLLQTGTKLVITVDCGISSLEETAAMFGKLDIIITDHHEPPAVLPKAAAIINPKRADCTYPEKQLAGVGVTFKLCSALWAARNENSQYLEDLDLVAVGTIADIVPLTGENRLLVRLGLDQLAHTDNVGLKSLLQACNIKEGAVDAGKVGFMIAPRLNASGRVGHASMAVELLTTSDKEQAKQIAVLLDGENSRRQALEKQILEAAEQAIMAEDLRSGKVIVVSGDNWHPGVIGIVASRLVDRYYRPAIVISVNNGIGKGSCRSIPGFDMHEALKACSQLLVKFGGHKQAAGLTIDIHNLASFRMKMNELAGRLPEDTYAPVLNIDTLISLEQINTSLLEQLACLAPHGMGNPAPVFACRELQVADVKPIGQEGKHLKLKVRRQKLVGDVIAWGMGEMAARLQRNESVDIAFAPEFNEWQGYRNIQLKALDVKKTQGI